VDQEKQKLSEGYLTGGGFDGVKGYNKDGFNKKGYNKDGFDRAGFDKEGYSKAGYNRAGISKAGFDRAGFDTSGWNRAGFNREGFNREGFDREGYNREGFDREGYNKAGYDPDGYNWEGYNREGYDPDGYNRAGYDPTSWRIRKAIGNSRFSILFDSEYHIQLKMAWADGWIAKDELKVLEQTQIRKGITDQEAWQYLRGVFVDQFKDYKLGAHKGIITGIRGKNHKDIISYASQVEKTLCDNNKRSMCSLFDSEWIIVESEFKRLRITQDEHKAILRSVLAKWGGYNKDGFDRAGYNKAGYNKEGYNWAGFDTAGVPDPALRPKPSGGSML
jgi:hypothetical protein